MTKITTYTALQKNKRLYLSLTVNYTIYFYSEYLNKNRWIFDGHLFKSISHFNNLNFLAIHWVCFPKVAVNNQFQNKTGKKENIKQLKTF